MCTKKEIEGYVKTMLSTNDNWAKRALIVVFNNQTRDEQKDETVNYHNNIGFTSADAKRMTGMAKFLLERNFLTTKQLAVVKRRMAKYWSQVLAVADLQKIQEQATNWHKSNPEQLTIDNCR